jgi:hypothetical protein
MKKQKNGFDGPTFSVWLALQRGQENIIRFGRYHERFPGSLRKQNGHEHRCSVGFLFMKCMIDIRPFIELDELLISRCIELHDIPEGITGIDLPSPNKRDCDDVKEYLVFQELFKPLGRKVWKEVQEAFLLQFALGNKACFPDDAQKVLTELYLGKRNEAVFFDATQRLDYLYYAYECYQKRRVKTVLTEVTRNQFKHLEKAAETLPGFGKVIWTPKHRKFFKRFL